MARPRGFSHQRSRRQTTWGIGPGATGVSVFSATGSQIIGAGIVPSAESKSTLVRLRGYVEIVLEAAANIGEGFQGAIGIGLVTDQAFAAGSASIPDPIDEQAWDGWMYHRHFSLHATTATISDGVNTGRLAWEIDSKAMRIWEVGNTLMMKMQVVEIGTSQIEVFFDSRVLVKLS